MTVYDTLGKLGISLDSDATVFPIQEAFLAMPAMSEFLYVISGGHIFTNLGDPKMGGLLHIIKLSNSRGYCYFYEFSNSLFKKYEKYLHSAYTFEFVKTCEGNVIN